MEGTVAHRPVLCKPHARQTAHGASPIDGHPAREEELPPWALVLVASSDAIKAIGSIVSHLPARLRAAIIVLQHRSATVHDLLPDILRMRATMPRLPQ
jgi:chemotaxis response regulator CheB